ncbi:MAG: hypothetical protein QNJ12_20750 [Ilumatobacter sp.]|uniref:hypothetical protein n=1 Tax=Ilumatobacter sp. TaxID=1967498 RepID=UPI00261AF5EF|nr:hypothetical protein [Ilumatobacter sp.]MDJ0771230.1 hypothetical protein [Ilumatobacter sp.]
MGLLAVGILILTVTPRRQESPVAVSASTTLATPASTSGSARLTESVRPQAVAGVTAISRPATQRNDPLATPVGDGRLALLTASAVGAANGSTVDVRFSTGEVEPGLVVASDRDLVIVEVDGRGPGLAIASDTPDDDEIVTVMATPPVTVAFADVDTLNVHEGTAVLDDEGNLVGLCSLRRGDGSLEVVSVSGDLAAATSDGR